MFKKIIVGICVITGLNSPLYSSLDELSELSITLQQLQNINTKLRVPLQKPFPRYQIPNKEFYDKLEVAIKDVLNGTNNLLDTYGNDPSAEVAQYILSIANNSKAPLKPQEIMLLVELFDRTQAQYEITDTLIIVSVAPGDLFKEKLLLKTLYHFGYKLAKFYAIDPEESINNILETFKEDQALRNYEYHYFKDTKSYIETIINKAKELPNICLTFYPGISEKISQQCSPPCNICQNNPKPPEKLTTMLLMPNNVNEISVVTSDQNFINKFNEYLANQKKTTFSDVKESAIKSLYITSDKRIACAENVLIDFLELVKLASSAKDCIAYYCGQGIATYHNIASQSIAQLYVETTSLGEYYKKLKNIDLTDFKIWTYNSDTNQFEQTK